jgi:hypothetical protein
VLTDRNNFQAPLSPLYIIMAQLCTGRPAKDLAEAEVITATFLAVTEVFRYESCVWSSPADPGRIYIKGYIYPICYPKIGEKDIHILFLSGICWRIYILILAIYTFLYPILSYILFAVQIWTLPRIFLLRNVKCVANNYPTRSGWNCQLFCFLGGNLSHMHGSVYWQKSWQFPPDRVGELFAKHNSFCLGSNHVDLVAAIASCCNRT